MRCRVLFCALALFALSGGMSRAQEPSEEQAPSDVLAKMPAKAVSILFGKYPIGPGYQEILIHVYAVPEAEKAKESGASYKREDFMGLNIRRSYFTADFLLRKGSQLERLNRVTFRNHDGVNGILIKWLEPKARRGPVVCIHLGATHWLGWELIAFPDGVRGRAVLKQFEYGGEGESGVEVQLDEVDRQGRMTVSLNSHEGEMDSEQHYFWNGKKFVESPRPNFVIAASLKTRQAAKAFCRQHGEIPLDDIQPSSHYPKLTPGYFIVIAERFETQTAANTYARKLSHSWGIVCYGRRAF